jgi:hypothetical protein
METIQPDMAAEYLYYFSFFVAAVMGFNRAYAS